MMMDRILVASSFLVVLAAAGCGGGDDASPPATAAAPAANAVPAKVSVTCLAQWKSGTSGTFACRAQAGKDVKITKETFRLQQLCVNDARLTTYAYAGGQTATIAAKGEGPLRCTQVASLPHLPETCSCVAPPGGDCQPGPAGFVCLANGIVASGG